MTASEDATLLQLFTRPDRYFARCGRLCAFIARHEIGGAPTFMRGLRIAFATDFHAIARTSVAHARALADQINALQADLVLLGGDYADRAEHVAPLFEGLAVSPLFDRSGNTSYAEQFAKNLRMLSDFAPLEGREDYEALVGKYVPSSPQGE